MELRRSVLVPYTAQAMFDLIEHAESYPQFLPWCTSATIFERSDDWVAARLEFSYLRFRFGFQTRNAKCRPHWLHVRLVEGPFRKFHADWTLTPLGDSGCKIEFDVEYEIADRILDRLARPAVEIVSRAMVDAFVKRAEGTLTGFAQAQTPAAAAAQTHEQVLAHGRHPTSSETAMIPTAPLSTLQQAVRGSQLAAGLAPEQANVLATVVRLQTVQAGELLAPEGAADNHLVEVVEGSLGVVKHRGTPEEALLATLNPGDFAHELGFLDGTVRYASLVASTDARVLVLEREGLETLIDPHPRIVYRVMCAIVGTVHRVQTQLAVQAGELTNYIVKQHGRY